MSVCDLNTTRFTQYPIPILESRNRGGTGRPQKADSYAAWVNSRLEQILYSDDESLKENFGF